MERDLVIIGGGPAGLAAAVAAYDAGVHDIVVIERESKPGGVASIPCNTSAKSHH